ncbi:malectin domain-containing carbohydrate-binding protein [Pelagicoccus sp. SDUM812002]|uniref:malectin domain-containing carbohydrate-binding protein n=1 Tax=Pelagicoccus sp. SDUM812002 TaxID=3041266 RepID=UPI00280CA552|nr:malectin domain-containing carbohydrate-binding protein [Pelagicoccus sp. SDUM812002]MDQ8188173.1 malectin domain-containing carbohydrate-binding protein [Pelagicoccus sp. SDUM812002]
MIRILPTFFFCLSIACFSAIGAVEGLRYRPEGTTFYIVHSGGNLDAVVRIHHADASAAVYDGVSNPKAAWVRAYASDESLVQGSFVDLRNEQRSQVDVALDFGSRPSGVYQVRVTQSKGSNTSCELLVDSGVRYGVAASRDLLTPDGGGLGESYFVVPEGTGNFELYNRSGSNVALYRNSNGSQVATISKGSTYKQTLSSGVYRMVCNASGGVGFSGIPGILCSDAATASAIGDSRFRAWDGRTFPHAVQARIWNKMQGWQASDFEVNTVDLSLLEAHWASRSGSASLLGNAGPFTHADYYFQSQDLEKSSSHYGSEESYAALAVLYSVDAPFNPYFKNQAVLKRLLVNQFRRVLEFGENGTLSEGWNTHSGSDILQLLDCYIAYYLCAESGMDSELQELWKSGLALFVDRFCLNRVSTENQTNHILLYLHCLNANSSEGHYGDIAALFAEGMFSEDLNRFYKVGYLQERFGADASYQGMSLAILSLCYEISEDPVILQGIRKISRFFSRTVVDDPDLGYVGATNFSHRTNDSWAARQWKPAGSLLANEVPSLSRDAGSVASNKSLEQLLAQSYSSSWYSQNEAWAHDYILMPWMSYWNEYIFREPDQGLTYVEPVSATPFSYDDEFVGMNNGAYKSLLYLGNTSPRWASTSYSSDWKQPGWSEVNGTWVAGNAAAEKGGWQPTQGVSLFATKGYGALVLARNWNLITSNATKWLQSGGGLEWTEYWSGESVYSPGEQRARLLTDLGGVEVLKSMVLSDSALSVSIELGRSPAEMGGDVVESLPILLKSGLSVDYENASSLGGGMVACDGIVFTSQGGETIRIGLDQRTRVRFVDQAENKGITIRALELYFDSSTLGYSLEAEEGEVVIAQPSAPKSVVLSEATPSAVTLSWAPSQDGAVQYRVWRDGWLLGTVNDETFTDENLSSDTEYRYEIAAVDAEGVESVRSDLLAKTTSWNGLVTVLRLNVGGDDFVDSEGNLWQSDAGLAGGNIHSAGVDVLDTEDDFLFRSERWEPSSGNEIEYDLPLDNGDFVVRLYFTEVNGSVARVGGRVFGVAVEDETVASEIDIFASVGLSMVHQVEVSGTLADGSLSIALLREIDNPKLNAIEVLQSEAKPGKSPGRPLGLTVKRR